MCKFVCKDGIIFIFSDWLVEIEMGLLYFKVLYSGNKLKCKQKHSV